MVPLSKSELLNQVVQSVQESGWNVLFLNKTHPFKLRIYKEDEGYNLKIIIYNLSHGGGRKRPTNEYRIQLKVDKIEKELGFITLILGYWKDVDVFAGFDFNKHKGIPGYSASLQIKEENLREAYINGFSACDKGNKELAIAFKPDFFSEYVRNYDALHSFGQSKADLKILENISKGKIKGTKRQLKYIPQKRKTAIVQMKIRMRANDFSDRVLRAYGFQCAVCNIQLKLIDASHIIPVNIEGSSDETSNGIALCPLHHRAYDRSLITFNEYYQVLNNENKMDKLREIGHDGKMEEFIRNLRPLIELPPSTDDRPNTNYIKRANKIRGW